MSKDLAISDDIMMRLQAGAFNSLCHHLRVRSDEVQNIDLMSISGFCRNCLAKVRYLFFVSHIYYQVTEINIYLIFHIIIFTSYSSGWY